MAKVQIQNRLGKIEIILRKALRDATLLRQLAGFLKLRIYQYTKRGYSLGALKTTTRAGRIGDPRKLKPLSPNYIKYRRELQRGAKSNASKALKKSGLKKLANSLEMRKFGEFFAPTRSNLTLTGQMLDALKTEIDAEAGQGTVYVDSTKRTDSDLTNAQVAQKVAEDGRPFLGLDLVGRDRIRRMVIADLRRKLKRR